jgi:hypothetical protein
MTQRERQDRQRMLDNLQRLGFSPEECQALRRISMQLRRWYERECNEDIRVDDQGRAEVMVFKSMRGCAPLWYLPRIPNMEAGATRRLNAIMARHSRRCTYYLQTDPRGCALYVVPLANLRAYRKRTGRETGLDCCYNSVGIAVY